MNGSSDLAAPALIWCPFGSEEDAAEAARQLLDEGLVGCANIIPAIRSIYEWDGERGDEREVAALFKTNDALLDRAVARLDEIHPYDTPAAIGWRAYTAAHAARQWLGALPG